MADRAVAGRKRGKEVAYQARRAVGKDTVTENLLRAAKPSLEKAEKAIRENPGKALAAGAAATALPAGATYLALRNKGEAKGGKVEKTAAEKADHIERGAQRAEGGLAARARKHEGSRGELYGDLVGRVLAGGAGLTAAKGKGDLAQVAAVALGQHLGGKAGRLLGKELDVRRDLRKASEGKKKHAFEGTEELGTPSGLPPGAPQGMAPQLGQPQASGSPEEVEAQEALSLEQQGAEAQAANEAVYYKELSRQESQAKQQLEGQMQAIQQELEQTKQLQEQQNQMVQQTLQGANNTATQALTQAVSSTQEAIRQRQQAADGAITLDRLRQSLRELADGGGSPGGPGDITGGGQQQMPPDQMQGAPADQAPSAGAPPDAQDPQGGYAPIQSQEQGEPQPAGQEGMVATASIYMGVRAFRKSRRVGKAMEDLSSRLHEELARSPRDAAALNSAAAAFNDAARDKQYLNSIALESLAVPATIATGVALPTVAAAGYFAGRSAKNRAAKAIAEEVLPEIASKRSKNLLPLAAGGVAVPALVGGAYLAGSASPEAAGQEGMVATASLYKEAKTSKIREGFRKYVRNLKGTNVDEYREAFDLIGKARRRFLRDADRLGDRRQSSSPEYAELMARLRGLDAYEANLVPGASKAVIESNQARALTGLGGAALLGGGAYALNKALKNRGARAVAEEALPDVVSKGSKNPLPLVAGGVALPTLAAGAYFAGSGSTDALGQEGMVATASVAKRIKNGIHSAKKVRHSKKYERELSETLSGLYDAAEGQRQGWTRDTARRRDWLKDAIRREKENQIFNGGIAYRELATPAAIAAGVALPAAATAGYLARSGSPDASEEKVAKIGKGVRRIYRDLSGADARDASSKLEALMGEGGQLRDQIRAAKRSGNQALYEKLIADNLDMPARAGKAIQDAVKATSDSARARQAAADLLTGGAVVGGGLLTAKALQINSSSDSALASYRKRKKREAERREARKKTASTDASEGKVARALPVRAAKRTLQHASPLSHLPGVATALTPLGIAHLTAEEEKVANAGAVIKNLVKERAPYALAGAALTGGLHQGMTYGGSDALREELAQAEAEGEEGGFRDALNTAQLKARLAFQEAAENYPGTSLGLSALAGGALGAVRGPAIADQIRGVGDNVKFLSKG